MVRVLGLLLALAALAARAAAQTPLPPVPAVITDAPSDIQIALDAHNALRANHDSPPLVWNQDLAASAGQSALQCSTTLPELDQNFAPSQAAADAASYKASTELWYSKGGVLRAEDYKFPYYGVRSNGYKNVEPFLSLIWKSTTDIGCARVVGCPASSTPFPGGTESWGMVVW